VKCERAGADGRERASPVAHRAGLVAAAAPAAHGHRGHRRAVRPVASGGSRIASGASRLCRPHCGDPVFVHLDDVAAGVCAARKPFEAFRSPEDDRVGVGAGLDLVPLFELPVEERVQPVPAGTEWIDLAHGREYRKPPVSEIGATGLRGYGGTVCGAGHDAFVRISCSNGICRSRCQAREAASTKSRKPDGSSGSQ